MQICLFVGAEDYQVTEQMFKIYKQMQQQISNTIDSVSFELEVRPYQLSYRKFDIYCCDISAICSGRRRFIKSLHRLVMGRPTAAFLFWTKESWEAFFIAYRSLRGRANCIDCSQDGWEELTMKLLDKYRKG